MMTHDELLAKIDACFAEIPVDYGQTNTHKALRAIVELHKPDKYYPEYCDVCWWEEHEREEYPCQTIQAVEKELS